MRTSEAVGSEGVIRGYDIVILAVGFDAKLNKCRSPRRLNPANSSQEEFRVNAWDICPLIALHVNRN